MTQTQLTKFELFSLLQNSKQINLSEFLNMTKLTQNEFIEIVCSDEISTARKKHGNTDVFSMKLAAKALDISYPHLVRLKKSGMSIQYTQDKARSPVYFPVWAIAVHNYLKSHPIIPGQTTFSNLLAEI